MRQPYARVAKSLLPRWEISLAFVDPKTAKRLNKTLRGKTYTPNVLAYTVGKNHGEVIICKSVARKEAKTFGLGYEDFLLLLFIHALLHLKGGHHGSTMERREQALLRKFKSTSRTTHGSSHRNRDRHRYFTSKDSRRRGDSR